MEVTELIFLCVLFVCLTAGFVSMVYLSWRYPKKSPGERVEDILEKVLHDPLGWTTTTTTTTYMPKYKKRYPSSKRF